MSNVMARPTLAALFYEALRGVLRRPELAPQLQAAADGSRLAPWTGLLTHAVVEACASLGWACAARGRKRPPLPVSRDEYLGIDVLAFPEGAGWRRPVAAFELENAADDASVCYAAWKAASVRAGLSCLVCYRRREDEIASLLERISMDVLGPLDVEREALVVVGTRGRSETFPEGYFRAFRWDQAARALRAWAGA